MSAYKEGDFYYPHKTITLVNAGRAWELRSRSFEGLEFKPNSIEAADKLEKFNQIHFIFRYYKDKEQKTEHLEIMELLLENWETFIGLLNPLANSGNITPFCYPEVRFYNPGRGKKVDVDLVGIDSNGHVYLVEVGTSSKRKRPHMAEELQAFGQHFPQAAVSGVIAIYGDRDQDRLFLDLDIMRP